MLNTVTAVVRDGKIELLERVELPEGSRLLVTVLPDGEVAFWRAASEASLNRIWDSGTVCLCVSLVITMPVSRDNAVVGLICL